LTVFRPIVNILQFLFLVGIAGVYRRVDFMLEDKIQPMPYRRDKFFDLGALFQWAIKSQIAMQPIAKVSRLTNGRRFVHALENEIQVVLEHDDLPLLQADLSANLKIPFLQTYQNLPEAENG
jgi:hypothetical protein